MKEVGNDSEMMSLKVRVMVEVEVAVSLTTFKAGNSGKSSIGRYLEGVRDSWLGCAKVKKLLSFWSFPYAAVTQ